MAKAAMSSTCSGRSIRCICPSSRSRSTVAMQSCHERRCWGLPSISRLSTRRIRRRSRSVFGGLWTDRTDAAALLRGKIEIGQILPANASSVAQLIHDGVAIFDLREVPAQPAWRDKLEENAGDAIEDAALLPVLRAVLEDNPLVVKVEWVGDGDVDFSQPSAGNPSPSPAECVEG